MQNFLEFLISQKPPDFQPLIVEKLREKDFF